MWFFREDGGWIFGFSATYVFPWIFLVAVVHARRDQPGAWEEAEAAGFGGLVELAGQKTGKFALDKLGAHAVGEEVRRREAVPVFAEADCIAPVAGRC